jgi:hypothetical protein
MEHWKRKKNAQVQFSLQISEVEPTKLPTKTRRALFCNSKASHCKSVKLKLQSFPQKQEEPCSAFTKLCTAIALLNYNKAWVQEEHCSALVELCAAITLLISELVSNHFFMLGEALG